MSVTSYGDLVNDVLVRMREEKVNHSGGSVLTEDPVVVAVMGFVDDAIAHVAGRWYWNALRTEWTLTANPLDATYPAHALTGAKNGATITSVFRESDGMELRNAPLLAVKRKQKQHGQSGSPEWWAISGANATGDFLIQFYPAVDVTQDVTFYGYSYPARVLSYGLGGQLVSFTYDTPVVVPREPTLLYALAYAARERGEIDGQTSMELLALAQQALTNAVQMDAALSDYEQTWTSGHYG